MALDQHPYFNVITACLAAITLAITICLGIAAWLLTEKARAAAIDRRIALIGEKDTARFRALLNQPIDLGPIKGDDGRWAL